MRWLLFLALIVPVVSWAAVVNLSDIATLDAAIQEAAKEPAPYEVRVATTSPHLIGRKGVVLSHGGTVDKPVTIVGFATEAETPFLVNGTRGNPYVPPAPSLSQICLGPCNGIPGDPAFILNNGANYLTFRNFALEHVGVGFELKGQIVGLRAHFFSANNIRKVLNIAAGGPSLKGSKEYPPLISDFRVFGNSKNAFHFRRVTNLRMDRGDIDCDFRDYDFNAAGISFAGNDPEDATTSADVYYVTVRNCKTTIWDSPGVRGFDQGDGATTEEHDKGIKFAHLRAFNNGDAGLDNKGATTCKYCEFGGNVRNVRQHPPGSLRLISPLLLTVTPSPGVGKAAHVQSNGGTVTIETPTISESGSSVIFKAEGSADIAVDSPTITRTPETPVVQTEPGAFVNMTGTITEYMQ